MSHAIDRTQVPAAREPAAPVGAGDQRLPIIGIDGPIAPRRNGALRDRRALAVVKTADLRRHMHAHVRLMSMLVPEALGATGVKVDTMLRGMRPCGVWPAEALVGTLERQLMMYHGTVDGHGRPHGQVRRWGSFGIPVPGLSAAAVMAEVVDDRIEFLMQGAGWILKTVRGRCRLSFDESLPDTAVAIANGERLDRVVEHPLLTGRGFMIDRIETTTASTSIEFAVAEQPVSVPDAERGADVDH